jgi:hypothetical protein
MRRLESWERLGLRHLALAYRKAKADCFFERSLHVSVEFARYEQDLEANLQRLLDWLRADRDRLFADPVLLGTPTLIPKKLGGVERKDGVTRPFCSDPGRAFEALLREKEAGHVDPRAEFRIACRFPVDTYVLSALWVNLVGQRFDAALRREAYGTRLRRVGAGKGKVGSFHSRAVGSFEVYVGPYRRWREGGLNAIERALESRESVVAVTTDFQSYYHRIDPTFLLRPGFLRHLDLEVAPGGPQAGPHASLTATEIDFTQRLVTFLSRWGDMASSLCDAGDEGSEAIGGLPIGLSAARLIANVLLAPLDEAVVQRLAPVFYGRYVDDLFLVLRDADKAMSRPEGVMGFISDQLPQGMLVSKTDERTATKHHRVTLGEWQGKTELILQEAKHRIFFLEGRTGRDLLDVIRRETIELSSERRLMPDARMLTSSVAARVLIAQSDRGEPADTLRKTDGLSLRRMSWAIQLTAAETLASDLDPTAWRTERLRFYRFATDHVLRPEALLEYWDYLPRLIGVALLCHDWKQAERLIRAGRRALRRLERLVGPEGVRVNGFPCRRSDPQAWTTVRKDFVHMVREAVVRAWPFQKQGAAVERPGNQADGLLKVSSLRRQYVRRWAPRLIEADLARMPLKQFRLEHGISPVSSTMAIPVPPVVPKSVEDDLEDFLRQTLVDRVPRRVPVRESLVPFLFPTRPYSTREIGGFVYASSTRIEKQSLLRVWGRWARAVRGIWVRRERDHSGAHSQDLEGRGTLFLLGRGRERTTPRVCLANFRTSDDEWAASAANTPALSRERYLRFVSLVNGVLRMVPRPDYLLLPELAVPRRWVTGVSNRLLAKGISLVAGVEYKHLGDSRVVNQAVLALTDDRLGFDASLVLWQDKGVAAPGEEEALLRNHGKTWPEGDYEPRITVYRHFGFDFGVLICSELQEIAHRAQFRGQVDALFVLSWNKDLETFSALVDSAALDVHAYVGLVNNREFGDSRLRTPAKESYLRDTCRIRGGENDYAAVVKLDVASLRRFQSRAKNWPRNGDQFKPVPQGFRIAARRRTNPGA